jgi:hypothetical protein
MNPDAARSRRDRRAVNSNVNAKAVDASASKTFSSVILRLGGQLKRDHGAVGRPKSDHKSAHPLKKRWDATLVRYRREIGESTQALRHVSRQLSP